MPVFLDPSDTSELSEISKDTLVFPWKKSTPYPALEATLAVAIALALGEATGHPAAGSIAAGAAFTVGFAVFHEALSSTLLSMAALTLGIASATLAGSLAARWTPLVLLLCVAAALNYGLATSLDATAGWIAQQCGVFVIISSYFSHGLHYAVGRTSMVLAGGALQMGLYALTHFGHHHSRLGDPPPPPFLRQLRTRALQLGRKLQSTLAWNLQGTSYTVRLALTLGLSTALYRRLHWHNGYWAPMTAMLVLKPKWTNTLSRGIARLVGTLAGAGLCAFLVSLHGPFPHWVYFVFVVLTAYACFALQAVNYAAFSTVLTLYVVFLFAFGGFSERSAAVIRLTNTAIGGSLALLVDFLFTHFTPRPDPSASGVK